MELKRLPSQRVDDNEFLLSSSDRYFDTSTGTPTLIGLSYDETREFIALNVSLCQASDATMDENHERHLETGCEMRWHQLHQKHESARHAWLRERATPVW